ncbi:hypothetical protein G6F23_015112 [Rhizopus arrhizus]|nr:hypothetical protein G6F23_015112 [Rhizopus arrhizus]
MKPGLPAGCHDFAREPRAVRMGQCHQRVVAQVGQGYRPLACCGVRPGNGQDQALPVQRDHIDARHPGRGRNQECGIQLAALQFAQDADSATAGQAQPDVRKAPGEFGQD